MRYCPLCRGEYQDWVEKCVDCGAPLVETLPEPEPEPESQIVTVNDTSYTTEPLIMIAEYSNFMDAKLGKEILESEGIKCFVPDEDTDTFSWTGVSKIAQPVLVVRESDSEKALEILRDIEKDNPEIRFLESDETEDPEPDDAETHD
jgi:hypothetical protein